MVSKVLMPQMFSLPKWLYVKVTDLALNLFTSRNQKIQTKIKWSEDSATSICSKICT